MYTEENHDKSGYYFHPQLGWVDAAIYAGSNIFSSIFGSRANKKAAQAKQALLQMQIQAQREQDERTQKLLKIGIVGAGTLLLGGLVINALVRPRKKAKGA